MNWLKVFAALLIVMLGILSCKEIPVNIGDPLIPESDKIVLIEELTGASCPNCPKGNIISENIISTFPGKVAVVAIHGDFLAQPIEGKSKYDFRNQKAKDLENWFKPWYGKPAASINRTRTNDDQEPFAISRSDLWQSVVEKELQKPHVLNILLASGYNETDRNIELDITAIPIVHLEGSYNISIFLTESEIIDAQSNGSEYIDNYEHNHVLMDMLTGFDGDSFGHDLKANDLIKRKYTYTLPLRAGLFNPDHMEFIVMISRNDPGDRTVIQAAYISVKG
ncbi:MAG: Omp28-related outer membrane protein [Saprospiraceae bacterium]|nr:Omp28-related outer membrane protein [Saprospiraceae bacterium]